MWSLGCILAELLTGYALLPGEDESDQLACIMELLGKPPQRLLDQSKRAKNFISAKGYPRYCTVTTLEDGTTVLGSGLSRRGKERKPPGQKDMRTALKGCDDPLFLDFLQGCLEWDPEQRMTPSTALKHTWFRRRLPRPPHSDNGSNSSQITLSENQTVAKSVHLTTPSMTNQSAHSLTQSLTNTTRSLNKTSHLLNSISSNGSGSSGVGGITMSSSVNNGNGIKLNGSMASSSSNAISMMPSGGMLTNAGKLRVHLSSSDDSMLSLNRSAASSVHSTHRHNHHHHHQSLVSASNGGAPKLPQIQQGNTVT